MNADYDCINTDYSCIDAYYNCNNADYGCINADYDCMNADYECIITKKTGKQLFVSGSVDYNQLMLPLIEKRIGQELMNSPDKFYGPS